MRRLINLPRTSYGILTMVFLLAAPSLLAQAVPVTRPDSAQIMAAMRNGIRMLRPAEFVLGKASEVALTPEQVSQLKLLASSQADSEVVRQRRTMVSMLASITDKATGRVTTSDFGWTGPVDEQGIRERTMRQAAITTESVIQLARDRHAVGALLTPAQIATLEQLEHPGMPARVRNAEPPRTLPGGIYFEFQVEKQVTQIPGTGVMRYPDMLRAARVEGSVLAQFVVDTSGQAEPGSLKILRSSHELFAQSVKDALPAMRFTPAEVGGRKVRQLVQQPFTCSLASEK